MHYINQFLLWVISLLIIQNTCLAKNMSNNPIYDSQSNLENIDKQFFIENKGQWPAEVFFLTQINGLDAWITNNGVLYDLYKVEPSELSDPKNRTRKGHRVFYKLNHINVDVKKVGKQRQKGYYNYLTGNDKSKHAKNVSLFKEAVVKNIYDGIDIRYYFDNGALRYDYIVHPGADPSTIEFNLTGTEQTRLNTDGDLTFSTRFGQVNLADLYCYQDNKENPIQGSFKQQNTGCWKIQIGDYDETKKLIIDPLVYSTFLGGGNVDDAQSIALDNNGNAYVTGYTQSPDFDTSTGAYQSSSNGSSDIIISKIGASGNNLEYSTYLGGSDFDTGESIAVDDNGNTYITGETQSTDFAVTSGAFQTTIGGSNDVFVTKIDATGSNLLYATYIGGSNLDRGYAIALDAGNNAYVTGSTQSSDYSTTSGTHQVSIDGNNDVFVTKLDATGNSLIYSTYIGGSDVDSGLSIAIDDSDNAYIGGSTRSNDFDVTGNAFQTTNEGGLYDVFVTKLDPTGNNLLFSTFIGGDDSESCTSIDVDNNGNSYITGNTSSTNYDVTNGAYQTTIGGNTDAFVTKLNANGDGLTYSTYLGGSDNDNGKSIKAGSNGSAYVTGNTSSTDYDITSGSYQTNLGGGGDAFVTKINETGGSLVYSTFIGGSNADIAYSISLDDNNNPIITGNTFSSDYDVTNGSYQTAIGGSFDIFITKLDVCSAPSITVNANTPLCEGETLNLTSNGGVSYDWTGPDNFASTQQNPSISNISLADSGAYVVNVSDANGCSSVDSVVVTVKDCLGLSSNSNKSSLVLFPNPSQKWITLVSNNAFQNATVTIYNTKGRRVYTKHVHATKQLKIELSAYDAGVYFVEVEDADGQQRIKLIKE